MILKLHAEACTTAPEFRIPQLHMNTAPPSPPGEYRSSTLSVS